MNRNSEAVLRPKGMDSKDDCHETIKITRARSPNAKLIDALRAGNLPFFKKLLKMQQTKFDPDGHVNGGFTPLLEACSNGYLDFVKYLLEELHANPNKKFDSWTPLIVACDLDRTNKKRGPLVAPKIVELLLMHGADVNVADKCGTTPLMLACKNGYAAVVRWLIIKGSTINAVDDIGWTAIFYAVSKNHAYIVKILVEAGANTTIVDSRGYTPKRIAEMCGFSKISELLPKIEERYTIPFQFVSYAPLADGIPRMFPKQECPAYFQDVYQILLALKLENLLEFLKEMGVESTVHMDRFQKSLLDFHWQHKNAVSAARVKESSEDNFYDILLRIANHLKELNTLKTSPPYVGNNIDQNKFGIISREQLIEYQTCLNELRATVKHVSEVIAKQNPLYIEFDETLKERKRRKIPRFFKIVIGFVVFVFIFKCVF